MAALRSEAGTQTYNPGMESPRHLAHVERIPIRWSDLDAMGHVDKSAYFRCTQQAAPA